MVAVMTLLMCLTAAFKAPAQTGAAANMDEQQAQTITGVVVDTLGQPIEGVTVSIRGTSRQTQTDEYGRFSIRTRENSGTIRIRFVGYHDAEASFTIPSLEHLSLELIPLENVIEEVEVSTGYQTIPKERATGSFVHIDNDLLNRSIGTNIIDRLDGVANGLLFDKRGVGEPRIQIRGLYTLTQEIAKPLIVLDGFPFEGNIDDINPNDVDNISILKDAAAASIWGAKAGNGVIVITTKSGSFNRPNRISINSNISIGPKPDLSKLISIIPSSDFIELEHFLFDRGAYDAALNSQTTRPAVSPVVEILARQRQGEISAIDALTQIDSFKSVDVRDDYSKYIYRPTLNQRYSANITGGSSSHSYLLSLGYDRESLELRGHDNDRITIRMNNSFRLSDKLSLNIDGSYNIQNIKQNGLGRFGSMYASGRYLYPYAQFADEDGNPLPLDIHYRKSFTDTAGIGKLLDWKYYPLKELEYSDNNRRSHGLVFNFGSTYHLTPYLNANIKYQYQHASEDHRNNRTIESFYTRNIVNRYTQIQGDNVLYAIPQGDILDLTHGRIQGHALRAQFDLSQLWGKHQVNAIVGAETRQLRNTNNSTRTYGFNDRLNATAVDYVSRYPQFMNVGSPVAIPFGTYFNGGTERTISMYGNASYTYSTRYTVSLSARRDASNLFGVNINEKWKPLWSAGLRWNLSSESFYNIDVLPLLNIRATYGYSGNMDNSTSAVPVIDYLAASEFAQITNIPYANLRGAPNPDLRWEQVSTFNLGVDFATKGKRVVGSVEYYQKKAIDVLEMQIVDITKGVPYLRSNSANIVGGGFDTKLEAIILDKRGFSWKSSVSWSTVDFKVTQYMNDTFIQDNGYVSSGTTIFPMIGYNPYTVVSYAWAGLNEVTGDPQGYINGDISNDYAEIMTNPLHSQVIHGPALPPHFGNMLNDISWKNISLSLNLTYRFGNYFRKPTISYSALSNNYAMHADYLKRWQTSGDEIRTTVPSMLYPASANRDAFYQYSSATVLRGDYIRLNDIRVSCNLTNLWTMGLGLENVQLYGHVSQLNLIIWKKSQSNIDPLFTDGLTPVTTWTLGLKINL